MYNVNLNWLYTGTGEMFRNSVEEKNDIKESSYETSDGLKHQGLIHRAVIPAKPIAGNADEVPYYDYDFIMGDGVGFANGNSEAPVYTMKIQGFPHCISFPTFGDSMESRIKSGSIVFARIIEWKDHLEYGQIYGVVMNDNRRYLKYIRKSKENDKTHFLLRSESLLDSP
ncbi:MAG: hypothetical protein EOP52_03025 [Sphingobacteriales bacterium]|nr:MAG: hypothetical protein EOP52_03025 [Sphingobacteriales bacterium]